MALADNAGIAGIRGLHGALGVGYAAHDAEVGRETKALLAVKAPRGSKTDLVLAAINRFAGEFTVSQLEQACPGVSRDMIRRVLRDQQSTNVIECQGRGPAARWKKKG